MDAVKCKQAYESEATDVAEPPSQIMDIPVLNSFFHKPEEWDRVQVLMIGTRPKGGGIATKTNEGIQCNRFLFTSKPDPYVTVETDGPDTGNDPHHFPVGSYSFSTKKNATLPSWDESYILLYKKDGTDGLKVTMCDGKDTNIIMRTTVSKEDLPKAGSGWKEYIRDGTDEGEYPNFDGLELKFRLKVTAGTEKIVSKEDMEDFCKDSLTINYTEEALEGEDKESPEDNGLLQCWQHRVKRRGSKAVLWFLGRNDCFMHPHVAKELFLDQGYDVYVLNWSCVGMCRLRGWVSDAWMNSHNRYGCATKLYNTLIHQALDTINSHNDYEKTLGYAHSTGGIILINYLIEEGDAGFDGFLFNSPLLDWDQVGLVGKAMETLMPVLKYSYIKDRQSIYHSSMLGVSSLTAMLKDQESPSSGDKVEYLEREVDVSAWSMALWSQYHFDFRARPFYTCAMTVGFVDFVSKVDKRLQSLHREKKHVTLKPVICFASKLDDTLTDYQVTLDRIDAIGPSREEVQMRHNSHDIFLSHGEEDNVMAMDMAKVWMKHRGFA